MPTFDDRIRDRFIESIRRSLKVDEAFFENCCKEATLMSLANLSQIGRSPQETFRNPDFMKAMNDYIGFFTPNKVLLLAIMAGREFERENLERSTPVIDQLIASLKAPESEAQDPY